MKINHVPVLHRLPYGTVAALAAISATLLICVPVFAGSTTHPVARVNGVTIYQSDLSCAVEASSARDLSIPSKKQVNPDRASDPVNDKKILDKLVNIELLYQESLKHRFHGLIAESDELYQNEVRRVGGEDKLAAALQCNDMSPEQFRKSIFRNLSIKHLLNEKVYNRIDVTQEEARNYYDHNIDKFRKPGTIRLKQILIKAPPDPEHPKWKQARDRAYDIYNHAVEGQDFVHLVKKHSEDPLSATAGGDLDPIEKGSIHGVIGTFIFTVKPGAVTKPIRTRQGFQIFKVTETTPPSTKRVEEVEQRITTIIRRKKARELTYQLISDLRDNAQVEIINSSIGHPTPGTR